MHRAFMRMDSIRYLYGAHHANVVRWVVLGAQLLLVLCTGLFSTVTGGSATNSRKLTAGRALFRTAAVWFTICVLVAAEQDAESDAPGWMMLGGGIAALLGGILIAYCIAEEHDADI